MSPSQTSPFDTVEDAVADIAAGRMVIVTDDEKRENEGDLIMAASLATAEAVGIMIRHGSGIVCVATTGDVLLRLGLGPMVANNSDAHRTDFAITVDAAQGVTTGISAARPHLDDPSPRRSAVASRSLGAAGTRISPSGAPGRRP